MHTNSALILNDPAVKETTSHFSMAWYQNDALDAHDLAVAGDVTVTRGVPRMLSQSAQDWWAGDGLRFVNLEGPLAGECPPQSNPFMFCLLEKKWLRISSLATHWGLANNHMLDLGVAGLQETERFIQAHGETPVTAAPWEDGRVRLLSVSYLMNPTDESSAANLSGTRAAVLKSLQESRPDELTVVLVHGGTEYRALTSDSEEKLYEQLIDAGADSVVVVHSHVVGDLHFYHDKPIFRGVGNFLFDQYDQVPTHTAKLVRLRKENGHVLLETLTSR
jgi:poly-gamma-glutamate capsule biosynthesis protein CapA/YwtB (metallophosphatase superfamily)